MEISLLICVLILMTCIFLSKLTHRLGLPTLLFFILLGMVFGSDGFFKISFTNYSLTEQLCTIALIFIIFYGGFGTSWKAARPVVKPALILSTLGVLLTALLTGFFCFFFFIGYFLYLYFKCFPLSWFPSLQETLYHILSFLLR